MILIHEFPEDSTNFKLLLSGSDQIIFGDSKNGFLQQLKIPKPAPSEKLTAGQNQVITKENHNVSWMEFSRDKQFIAVAIENKQLVIYDKTFQIRKTIILQRAASKVCFSATNDILVADRTGDVYQYKMTDEKSDPVLLLGHLSVILDMLITPCGKYIITCDRDEKIRVSHYPNTYSIATFCLGHTEFVTTLKLVEYNNILLSASGDGTVRMWKYLEGKQVNIINVNDLVDKKIIDKFVSQMDIEKVDVTVLPVTDLQIREKGSKGILAISLYSVDKLYLYGIDFNSLEYSHLESVDVNRTITAYCLCDKLYILSDKLSIYQFMENKTKAISYKNIEDKLLKYKDLFVNSKNDITLFYKRKFDNVQEYMERKKLRLETK